MRAFEPASADEAAAVMAQAAREKLRLSFVGGGTQRGLGRAPVVDAEVRTAKLARILEYAPSDMVMICEAGVTLAQIEAVAREQQQQLSLDAPHPERSTVGGVVSTATFGPLRARYGSVRDLLIGVTLVRADGVVARGGGKVVKNVAGFDLPKVVCGALGTLGLVAAANFRLHPRPELSATALFLEASAARVPEILKRVRESQLEPTCAVAVRTARGAFDLGVRFDGFAKGVDDQLSRLLELSRVLDAPCERLGDEAAKDFWARHDRVRSAGSLRVRLASLPSRLVEVDALVAPILGALNGGQFAWYATLGFGFIAGDPAGAAGASRAIEAARSSLVASGGALVIESAPDVLGGLDPWGPPPGSFAIMRGLKERFDPDRRMNPGRFVGGL